MESWAGSPEGRGEYHSSTCAVGRRVNSLMVVGTESPEGTQATMSVVMYLAAAGVGAMVAVKVGAVTRGQGLIMSFKMALSVKETTDTQASPSFSARESLRSQLKREGGKEEREHCQGAKEERVVERRKGLEEENEWDQQTKELHGKPREQGRKGRQKGRRSWLAEAELVLTY